MSHLTKKVKVYCRYATDDEQRCIKESLQYRDIDVEIADEIEELTKQGIRTKCSCSGHGNSDGYIIVHSLEDSDKMEALDYVHHSDDNYCHVCGNMQRAFVPKSNK